MSELSIISEVKCEVAILRRVEHPNLCRLYNVFETPDEMVLSMELLSGKPLLEAVIARQHYSEDDARGCIIQLLDAVAYLHTMGVCHRDIKPENCIFTSKDLQVCCESVAVVNNNNNDDDDDIIIMIIINRICGGCE